MKIVIAGDCVHLLKSTRIGDGWNVRCYTNDTVNQEIRVMCREDIGVAVHEMLRMEDKCGNHSKMAMAARKRFNSESKYRGYKMISRAIVV